MVFKRYGGRGVEGGSLGRFSAILYKKKKNVWYLLPCCSPVHQTPSEKRSTLSLKVNSFFF